MIHRAELRKAARALGLTLTRDHLGTYRLHSRGSARRHGRAVELPDLGNTTDAALGLWAHRSHGETFGHDHQV